MALWLCGPSIWFPSLARADGTATLRGTVIDKQSREPVAGALITVGSELVASADDGTFTMTLSTGKHTLRVIADWLKPRDVSLDLHAGDNSITIETEPSAGGEHIDIIDIAPTAIGETKVDAKLAKSVPGGGDAGKVVQSLPAVARPSAGSTEIVVWGAAPRDTRVFVDGVPVPQLFHLGGYRSAVGSDLIGDVRLSPAAFGVERGRAIGGVIDIGMADPHELPRAWVQADVLDASAGTKLRVGKLDTATSLRASYLDRAIALFEDPATLAPNAPLPAWLDGQSIGRAQLRDDLVLTAWLIASRDVLDRRLASDDPATETSEDVTRTWARAQATLRRDREDGYETGTLWLGFDRNADDYAYGTVAAHLHTTTFVGGLRAVQEQRPRRGPSFTYGLDLDGEVANVDRFGSLTTPAREGDIHIFGQPPGDDVAADRWNSTTIDGGAHLLAHGDVEGMRMAFGLRADAWLLTASRLTPRVGTTPGIGSQQILYTLDPRMSWQYPLTKRVTIRNDTGRYHQARSPTDTSAVFGTPTLGVEEAWHTTLGAQWQHAPFAIEAAGYLRYMQGLVARDLAVTPPLAKSLTQGGVGRVLGVQITARIVGWRGLSGWLSYNLSSSRRRDDEMQDWRYFDHDQTHGLVAVASYERGRWNIGARVRLATGEPRTGVLGGFFDSRSGRYQPIRGPHNGERLPAFFAADLRAQRTFAHGAVYLEVQNLTARANAEEIIYSADFSQHGYLTGLPLLVLAGVRLEAK